MKASIPSIALGLFTVGLLVATGCRGISTAYTQDIGGARFPASDPAKIEILRDVPARPHVELGQVWAHSSDRNADASELEDALRKEAAKLGADAFVVWRDEIQTGDGANSEPGGSRALKAAHGRSILGAAIKYP
jgi:hypothetical protein